MVDKMAYKLSLLTEEELAVVSADDLAMGCK